MLVAMAGTTAEYERMALKSIEKAAEDMSDTNYHLARARIFAALATAAANEANAEGGPSRRPAPVRAPGGGDDEGDYEGDGRHLPAVVEASPRSAQTG